MTKPKVFDRQVPLRIDKKTHAALYRMQKHRRATIASLIRCALDEALETPIRVKEVIDYINDMDTSYKFSTMFLTSSDQYSVIDCIANVQEVSRNSFIVAAVRLFVQRQQAEKNAA